MTVIVTAYFKDEILPEDYQRFLDNKRYEEQTFKEWYIENFDTFNLDLNFEVKGELE